MDKLGQFLSRRRLFPRQNAILSRINYIIINSRFGRALEARFGFVAFNLFRAALVCALSGAAVTPPPCRRLFCRPSGGQSEAFRKALTVNQPAGGCAAQRRTNK
jgi:hypothetical protein